MDTSSRDARTDPPKRRARLPEHRGHGSSFRASAWQPRRAAPGPGDDDYTHPAAALPPSPPPSPSRSRHANARPRAKAPPARGSGGLSPARRGATLALLLLALLATGLPLGAGASGALAAHLPVSAGAPSTGAARLPVGAGHSGALAAHLPVSAGTSGALATGKGVLLAFLPSAPAPRRADRSGSSRTGFEARLAAVTGLSIGIMSATQGRFTTAQLLLDVGQGARIASSAYSNPRPPALSLQPLGGGGVVRGWQAARRRAEDAPQLLHPGLLATWIAGGTAGYAGIAGADHVDGAVAADREGHVAAVSIGAAGTLLARVAALRRSVPFVVADLPAGPEGFADLQALAQRRAPGDLLVVVQRVPDAAGGELLWSAVAGLGGGGELTSASTNQRGLVAAIDLAPTILRHLGVHPMPAGIRGSEIEVSGRLHSASLRGLMARLLQIGGRRLKALACLLSAWAVLLLLCAPWPRARARAMRAGALGMLWTPVAVLIPAAIEPSAAVEYAMLTVSCLLLGFLTDRLLAWPRALVLPALVAIIALVFDALAGTQLLMRALLGPNPALGARFYGIGNELKSGLAVLVLAAVAAALYPAIRGRRAAVAMALAGILLAVVEGSARIGAGVGGVVLVGAGFAVATVILAGVASSPGASNRRLALIVLITPLVGLVALAALDLLTAHGTGHFTGSILHARSAGDLRDVIVRRYTAAWDELRNHAMPAATALALLYAAVGVRRRDRLLIPVGHDPAWLAALAGGLAAGVVGALAEDSGPVLLVVAVFALGCVTSYLWGAPQRPPLTRRSLGTTRAGQSRARTRSAAPSR
jgi:hypothetical protein